MRIVVVATDDEYRVARAKFKRSIIIKTGVGGVNVYRKLRWLPRWIPILNFGYAGSNKIPVGTKVFVGFCRAYHPNVEFEEPTMYLQAELSPLGEYETVAPCLTSGDFVTETKLPYPCVFDMELAYILAMGFRNVSSLKIVSDSLNLREYEENVEGK